MPISAPDRRLGISQTWQNVTGSRALGTTYTNTTGRPIVVLVQGVSNATSIVSISPTVNGSALPQQATYIQGAGVTNYNPIYEFIVPPNATYSVAMTTMTLSSWWELR